MKRYRIAVLFDNFGPYHQVRLQKCSDVFDLLGVEFGASSSEYVWTRDVSSGFKYVTLNPDGPSAVLSRDDFGFRVDQALGEFNPEAVAIPGWGSPGALLALAWCLKNRVPAILMSDSTEWDHKRVGIREWIKARIIGCYSAALVAGTPHKDYLTVLGFPASRVSLGYDVVDNDFFQSRSDAIRNRSDDMTTGSLPSSCFFLASARFVEKKNLEFLIRSYAHYRNTTPAVGIGDMAWDLVVLGDGPLRERVYSLRKELGLENCIHFPGFKQYDDLPAYYGSAGVFVHASTTEQWGLVVNEAMASGLPVLISNSCGCAADLVRAEENGFTFDPYDLEELASLMQKVSSSGFPLFDFGLASRRIIAEWGPTRFALGLKTAVENAEVVGSKNTSLPVRLLLRLVSSI